MKSLVCAGVLCVLIFFLGCKEHVPNSHRKLTLDSLQAWRSPDYAVDAQKIRQNIAHLRRANPLFGYADKNTNSYYESGGDFLWITRYGTATQADTLLQWLNGVSEMGFSTDNFYVQKLQDNLQRLRTLDFSAHEDANSTLACIEYYATKAYCRYAVGQRFGFINPKRLLNALEKRDTTRNSYFKTLFDVDMELPDSAFLAQTRESVRKGTVGSFLRSVQPTDSLYYRYLAGYQRHKKDSASASKWIVNLERSRWRAKQQREGKYVLVNIPAFALQAVDEQADSVIEMKICCGQKANKTPLLNSRINALELNPYWVVPYNIVKKEIAPRHACDVAYFTRNRMKIINKSTGKEINPASASAEVLLSGNVRVRQDNGEGNSLGRMIFRFPNNFSVFLHDTTNKGAFNRSWRGVSHGCVRLERPLDLAVFLLHDKDDLLIDKIRIAIGISPLTDKGRRIAAQTQRPVGYHTFKPSIPVFISYYTLFPAARGGEMRDFPDVYGYDEVIWEKLKQF